MTASTSKRPRCARCPCGVGQRGPGLATAAVARRAAASSSFISASEKALRGEPADTGSHRHRGPLCPPSVAGPGSAPALAAHAQCHARVDRRDAAASVPTSEILHHRESLSRASLSRPPRGRQSITRAIDTPCLGGSPPHVEFDRNFHFNSLHKPCADHARTAPIPHAHHSLCACSTVRPPVDWTENAPRKPELARWPRSADVLAPRGRYSRCNRGRASFELADSWESSCEAVTKAWQPRLHEAFTLFLVRGIHVAMRSRWRRLRCAGLHRRTGVYLRFVSRSSLAGCGDPLAHLEPLPLDQRHCLHRPLYESGRLMRPIS